MTATDKPEPGKTAPIRDLQKDEIDNVSGGAVSGGTSAKIPSWTDPDPLPIRNPKTPGWTDPDPTPVR